MITFKLDFLIKFKYLIKYTFKHLDIFQFSNFKYKKQKLLDINYLLLKNITFIISLRTYVRILFIEDLLLHFFLFFFYRIGVWTQGYMLVKQTLYCLSHTSSPFCSGYFGDGDIMSYLPGLVSNHNPPDLSFSSS
jgi:hypothetical protein